MKMRKLIAGVFVGTSLLAGRSAMAAIVDYTIVQANSMLTMGGTIAGSFASGQTGGSLTTSYAGTIKADRVANTIEFVTGSSMDAATSGNYFPNNSLLPLTQAADYGRVAPAPFPFSDSDIREAWRNVILAVSSDHPITISGTTFPSDQFTLDVVSADEYWILADSSISDQDFLDGKGTAQFASTPQSTVEVINGNVERLTLKFNTGNIVYSSYGTNDSTVSFTGTIIAERQIVPEPGTFALLGLMAPVMLRRRGR